MGSGGQSAREEVNERKKELVDNGGKEDENKRKSVNK